jgi:hypothetical protein
MAGKESPMTSKQTPVGDDLDEIPKSSGILDDPETVEDNEDEEIEEDNEEEADDEPEHDPGPDDDEGDASIREPD